MINYDLELSYINVWIILILDINVCTPSVPSAVIITALSVEPRYLQATGTCNVFNFYQKRWVKRDTKRFLIWAIMTSWFWNEMSYHKYNTKQPVPHIYSWYMLKIQSCTVYTYTSKLVLPYHWACRAWMRLYSTMCSFICFNSCDWTNDLKIWQDIQVYEFYKAKW